MVKRIRIGELMRALIVQPGRFLGILGPGTYWLSDPLEFAIEYHDLTSQRFASAWQADLLARHPEVVEEHFVRVQTGRHEVALVFANGELREVIRPQEEVLYWNRPAQITYLIVDVVAAPEVHPAHLPLILRLSGEAPPVVCVSVAEGEVGLLLLNHRFIRSLVPGTYGFWNLVEQPSVELVEVQSNLVEELAEEVLAQESGEEPAGTRVVNAVDGSLLELVLNPATAGPERRVRQKARSRAVGAASHR